jgi:hypothetical protein
MLPMCDISLEVLQLDDQSAKLVYMYICNIYTVYHVL